MDWFLPILKAVNYVIEFFHPSHDIELGELKVKESDLQAENERLQAVNQALANKLDLQDSLKQGKF